MKNYFTTTDFNFACFLKASGVDLSEVNTVGETRMREFVFRINSDSDELADLEHDWKYSDKAVHMKRILFASKMLRKALKTTYES